MLAFERTLIYRLVSYRIVFTDTSEHIRFLLLLLLRVDRFVRFRAAHSCVQLTQTQDTERATGVPLGRICDAHNATY